MPVPQMSLSILFVKNPTESAAFYSKILGVQPIEQSPTFAMFALPNEMFLGLWSLKTAEPPVQVTGGGNEICFVEEDVDQVYNQWVNMGIPMAQKPTDMDFGRTFVALDPDGHRIRIYKVSQ
jgi:predicted enzyme related to lactoylglutathione lyase